MKANDICYDHSFAMLVGGYMEGDTVTFGKKVVILMKKRSYASGSFIPQWVQYMVMYSLEKGNREKKLTSAALFNAVKDGFVGVDQVIGRLKRMLVCSFMYEGSCGEGFQEIATFIGRLVVDLLVTTTMSDEEATDYMMKLADDLPTDSNAAEILRWAKLLIKYADKGVVRRCWIGGRVVDMDSPEMKEIEMMIEQVLLEEKNEDEKKNKEKVDEAMTRVKQLLTPYWNSQIVSEILKNVVAIYIDNTNVRNRLFDFLNLCCREGVITAAMMKAGFNKFKKDILARFESYSICLKEAEKLGWFTEE